MLASKLNINGYYSQKELSKAKEELTDSYIKIEDTIYYIRNYLFYNDGIMLYDYVKRQFQRKKPFGYKTGMARWGNYTIIGDTIKAFIYASPGTQGLGTVSVWFKIIDSTTVKKILFKRYEYEQITQQDIIAYQKRIEEEKISEAKFIPYDDLPDPNLSWIKKKKWFWCDKEQYKIWKREMKKRKAE